MEDKLEEITKRLILPGALISLFAGSISVYKDSKWYIYIPLFVLTALLLLYSILKRRIPHDFETIWNGITIDILDSGGREANVTNHKQIKSTRNGAQHFQYILFADGIISDITTSSGVITSIRREGGNTIVDTNTEYPLQKGKVVDQVLNSRLGNAFLKQKEYWQTTKHEPGSKIKITILCPNERPIKEYKAYKIVGQTQTLLEQQPIRITHNNKHGVELDFQQARFLEKYRIEWTW